jgi:hypothetical protein
LVENDLCPARCRVNALVTAQLSLDDLDLARQIYEVPSVTSRKVIEDTDRVASLKQLANKV